MPDNKRISIGIAETSIPEQPDHQPMQRVENYWPEQIPLPILETENILDQIDKASTRKSKKLKRFAVSVATLAILVAAFVGLLFGTHAYLSRSGFFAENFPVFSSRMGVTVTDINLRPEPHIRNEPIGVVTKNSRVRVLQEQNNWYQIQVIEQGRQREPVLSTDRGWVNGRYVKVD